MSSRCKSGLLDTPQAHQSILITSEGRAPTPHRLGFSDDLWGHHRSVRLAGNLSGTLSWQLRPQLSMSLPPSLPMPVPEMDPATLLAAGTTGELLFAHADELARVAQQAAQSGARR